MLWGKHGELMLHLTPQQRPAISFALQQALHILQLPQIELALWIRQEIDKNPLLEEVLPLSPPLPPDIPSFPSLHDHLLHQIRESSLAVSEQALALELLHHLDEKGFLTLDPIPAQFLPILSILQTFDPPGIFARNLQEALLLQLKALGDTHSPSYRLVRDCFQDLLQGRFKIIEKKLGPIELSAAVQKLARLSMRPARNFQKEPAPTAIADLRIFKTDHSWLLEVAEEELPRIEFHSDYSSLTPVSPEERQSLKEWSISAKWLFRSLKRRRQILLQLGAFLTQKQAPYLEQKAPLYPLTLSDAAQSLDLHESTLSRALSNKYVTTPRGLLPLRSFFTTFPKDLLKELISSEDKKSPFTDDELAHALTSRGHPIARRTVAKYRKELRIGSASARKHLDK